jgi:hypothetical protein
MEVEGKEQGISQKTRTGGILDYLFGLYYGVEPYYYSYIIRAGAIEFISNIF